MPASSAHNRAARAPWGAIQQAGSQRFDAGQGPDARRNRAVTANGVRRTTSPVASTSTTNGPDPSAPASHPPAHEQAAPLGFAFLKRECDERTPVVVWPAPLRLRPSWCCGNRSSCAADVLCAAARRPRNLAHTHDNQSNKEPTGRRIRLMVRYFGLLLSCRFSTSRLVSVLTPTRPIGSEWGPTPIRPPDVSATSKDCESRGLTTAMAPPVKCLQVTRLVSFIAMEVLAANAVRTRAFLVSNEDIRGGDFDTARCYPTAKPRPAKHGCDRRPRRAASIHLQASRARCFNFCCCSMLSSNEPWAYMAPAVDAGARLVHDPAVDAAPGPSGRASSAGIDGAGKAAYKRVRDHDAHGHETATLTYREGTTPGSKYEGFAAPPSPLEWARRHRARGGGKRRSLARVRRGENDSTLFEHRETRSRRRRDGLLQLSRTDGTSTIYCRHLMSRAPPESATPIF
jgi:hypothetical protein